jgi:hypothetical protein
MPTFLACVGGAHGRGEGANVREGARTAEGRRMRPEGSRMCPTVFRMRPLHKRMRPSASRMRPQQPRPSNVVGMWQPPWTK